MSIINDTFGLGDPSDPDAGPPPPALSGIVATAAASTADTIDVTVVALDGGRTRVGPCLWMPRPGVRLPERGDPCLVVFDETGAAWVPAWIPAT